ncbi:MAG: hypothetical protein RBU37_03795 [Myxococcota bacterium]|jgi:hypothetical protein|nr:hypothetical protein [Myxococcota bacterium]
MSNWVETEMRGQVCAVVPCRGEALRLRAAQWFKLLHQLGLHVPFVFVLDLGQLFSLRPTGKLEAMTRLLEQHKASQELQTLVNDWASLCRELNNSEIVQKCQGWRLKDEVVAVLLTKLLAPILRSWAFDELGEARRSELPAQGRVYESLPSQWQFDKTELQYFSSFLRQVLAHQLQLRHAVEQLDIDTLRLLGLFRPNADQHNPLEIVDLLSLFSMPMVNDIVNFSLQLIPSVLEASRLKDAQIASMDGYEGLERVGHIDNLLLSEMAFDDDIFEQKMIDNELFYFARTRAREEEKKLHYIMIDSSASMRGRRTVFARGVALALIKKLMLQGEYPILRFFDSRAYEPIEIREQFSVPYLLAFQSERGRNYARVFEQVLGDLRRQLQQRCSSVVLYFFTHGQCHIPLELVMRLREVSYLFGIFVLPGDNFELDYSEMLHKLRIVREDALRSAASRKKEGLSIIDEASR